jgi:CxxC motif-containing protein (DUF1111 family)
MLKPVFQSLLALCTSTAIGAGCIPGDADSADIDGDQTAALQLSSDSSELSGGIVPVSLAYGVRDPGVRGGPPGAGQPVAGLNDNELAMFNEGKFRVSEFEATCTGCEDLVIGTPIPPDAPEGTTNSAGLGARFNGVSCNAGCHSQPTLGGTSPAVNPSFFAARHKGGTNRVPFFETIDGPTREVRFQFNPDGTRDGGVTQKFTVTGRSDAPNCRLEQPDFEANRNNMTFRIPTSLFGLGLIDAIQDVEILAHKNRNRALRAALGIRGITNNSPNDGTISRFGWKAQNKSVTQFSGEAYNVELGITNDLNPTSKTEDDDCNLASSPADMIHTGDGVGNCADPNNCVPGEDPTDDFNAPTNVIPVWMSFMMFMRLLDQPTPVALTASAERGRIAFNGVGCAECHTPMMRTKAGDLGSFTPALRGKEVRLYSDLLLHQMGARLADNVIQGNAGPDMFRTAPLWGIGKRLFFLHDGRARTLDAAIFAHYSNATPAHGRTPAYVKSEANQVIVNYARLPAQAQQDVLNFLRSL